MSKSRPGQPEVVQHVIQRLPGNGDAKRVHGGEVRQANPARLVCLAEYHVPLGAVSCAPVTDAPFQGAPDTRVQFGMAPHQFLENAHRANAGIVLQHRHNLGVKNIGQRVWTPPSPRGFLLRGKCRIPLDPVAGGSTETCLRGGYFSGAGFPVFHERPHLVISYMAAGPLALLYREYRETITDRPQSPKEDRQNFYPAAFNYNRTTPFLR